MSVQKKLLVDLDAQGVSKIKGLPAASASGEAVRWDEHDELNSDVLSLIALTGVAENAEHFGSFNGSTITANQSLKDILSELEEACETNQLEVKANSTAFLDITNNEIELKSLAVTSVTVNTVETSLANYLANEPSEAAGLQEGDVLILTAADSQFRSWINNGNTNGDATDWTRLQTDITPSAIRSYFSGEADHIDYDSATGVFTFSDNAVENLIPTTHTWQGLGTPSSVQHFMELADEELKNIQGGTSLEVGSVTRAKLADDAVDGTKLADDAVGREHLEDDAVGSDEIESGAIDFVHLSTDMITDDLSSSAASTEVPTAQAMKAYVDGRTYLRHADTDADLVANTALTITHSLGNKYVTCQVYSSADKMLDVEVTLIDENSLELKSTVNQADCKVIIIG